MRIVIIGAGTTGRNLVSILSDLRHDVVLVDRDAVALAELESTYDLLTVQGDASKPETLEKASIDKADLLLAVTSEDAVNILACIYAKAAGVPHKVARVTHAENDGCVRWNLQSLGVDLLVSQNDECARELFDVLMHPGALEVLDLLDAKVYAVGARVAEDSALTGVTLSSLGEAFSLLSDIRFIAMVRDGRMTIPRGDTQFRVGDEVYVVLRPEDASMFLDWVYPSRPTLSHTVLGGGGALGLTLARRLETHSRHQVVVLEKNKQRADACAERLNRTQVLCGDASKREMLEEAGIGSNAAFTAVTGDDELNIVSCVLAKTMGAAWTVAQVSKPEYVPIIRHMRLLDRVVSPYLSMINAILHYVRGRNVHAASLFQQLPGELLDVVVSERNPWQGKTLREIKSPPGAIIAMVQRDQSAYIPTGAFRLGRGDRLLMFAEPKAVERVAAIFQK